MAHQWDLTRQASCVIASAGLVVSGWLSHAGLLVLVGFGTLWLFQGSPALVLTGCMQSRRGLLVS
jgi:hypothetical protein